MHPASSDSPTPDAILQLAVDALDELKAVDIKVLDVRELTTVTDYMVVASGTSGRQVRALSENLQKRSKEGGVTLLGIEGERDAEWVLVDLCDVVVHVMNPTSRETYQIEKLWTQPPGGSVEDAATAP
ncbi:MAG: ribosome silencing factor [Pseudomonadota bacterium]